MPTISILCVHGIGHGDADAALAPSWREAITTDIQRWRPDLQVEVDFLGYDDLFDHAPLNAAVYGEAFARLLASGVVHGIGTQFSSQHKGFLNTGFLYTVNPTAGTATQGAQLSASQFRFAQSLAIAPLSCPLPPAPPVGLQPNFTG